MTSLPIRCPLPPHPSRRNPSPTPFPLRILHPPRPPRSCRRRIWAAATRRRCGLAAGRHSTQHAHTPSPQKHLSARPPAQPSPPRMLLFSSLRLPHLALGMNRARGCFSWALDVREQKEYLEKRLTHSANKCLKCLHLCYTTAEFLSNKKNYKHREDLRKRRNYS